MSDDRSVDERAMTILARRVLVDGARSWHITEINVPNRDKLPAAYLSNKPTDQWNTSDEFVPVVYSIPKNEMGSARIRFVTPTKTVGDDLYRKTSLFGGGAFPGLSVIDMRVGEIVTDVLMQQLRDVLRAANTRLLRMYDDHDESADLARWESKLIEKLV
jgi:hypothetical protein